eukprot:jgi/Mesen1/2218/ME000152S01306
MSHAGMALDGSMRGSSHQRSTPRSLQRADSLMPLLDRGDRHHSGPPQRGLHVALGYVMAVSLFVWVLAFVLLPFVELPAGGVIPDGSIWERLQSDYFGISGPFLGAFGAPVLLIPLVAPFYLALPRGFPPPKPSARFLWWQRMATYPALVWPPLGVLTAAELACGGLFILLLMWNLGVSLAREAHSHLSAHESDLDSCQSGGSTRRNTCRLLMSASLVAAKMGHLALIVLALLFFPVARASVLLRLLNVSFARAVTYHSWLGHLLLLTATCHGVGFLAVWAVEGTLGAQRHVAAGLLALALAAVIWLASLAPVRRRSYETFLFTHQLYVIFLFALALHVSDFLFAVVTPGVLVFGIDRLLRFVQARRDVGLLAARELPSGNLELVIAKPLNLMYSALSHVSIRAKVVSLLQFHPFMVTSSSLSSRRHITVLVQPSGAWTAALATAVRRMPVRGAWRGCPTAITLNVEGPYGYDRDFYLRYDALVLVARGVGIAPFLAVLRDLFHRYRLRQSNLPPEITLIWTVQHASELAVLRSLPSLDVHLGPAHGCHLACHLYICAAAQAPGVGQGQSLYPPAPHPRQAQQQRQEQLQQLWLESAQETMSAATAATRDGSAPAVRQPAKAVLPLGGPARPLSTSMFLLFAILGTLLAMYLLGRFVIFPVDRGTMQIFPWYWRGALSFASVLIGIGLSGGGAVAAWFIAGIFRRAEVALEEEAALLELQEQVTGGDVARTVLDEANVSYGQLPVLEDLIGSACRGLQGANVGVLVSGPADLCSQVARECQVYGFAGSQAATLHYHAVGFNF